MGEFRLLSVLFCVALAVVSLGWPHTWPLALGAALMFYGFYRWLWLELVGWFSVILAALAGGMVLSAYPLSILLLFLGSLLACLFFVAWEVGVHVAEGWQALGKWWERRKETVTTERE